MNIRRILFSIKYRVIGPLRGRDGRNWASKTDFVKTHRRQFKNLKSAYSTDEAARIAVGGEFEATGLLLRETVIPNSLYEAMASFQILDLQEREVSSYGREPGVVQPALKWTTEQID